MRPLAIFYHTCLNLHPDQQAWAVELLQDQVATLKEVGLLQAVGDNFFVGLNGDLADFMAASCLLPENTNLALNDPSTWASGECPTLNALREYCKVQKNINVLYLHMKGLSHFPGSPTHEYNARWRYDMERVVLRRWRECVNFLESGYQTAGHRWYESFTGNYYAGNFWWATSNYLATLPVIQPAGHLCGGRYEAETWIGKGNPRHINL